VKKKLLILLCVLAISIGLSVNSSFAADNITIFFNNNQIEFDVNPCLINYKTMVPIRAITEAADAIVDYNDETKAIIITRNEKKIKLIIDSTNAIVDDKKVILDTPATVISGRTFVPLRFISESMGFDVTWNSVFQSAYINDFSQYTKLYDNNGLLAYYGQLNDKGQKGGYGRQYAADGSIMYEGQWIEGNKSGVGYFQWQLGDKYEGNVLNNEASGYGKLTHKDIGYYIGYFSNGKRQGEGSFYWNDGDRYSGSWNNDMMTGYGTYYSNGQSLKGNWINNIYQK